MRSRFVSLRLKLAGGFAVLMIALAVFVSTFFPYRAEKSARASARDRAVDIALVIANAVRTPLDFDSPKDVETQLALLESARDASYGAVFLENGARFAAWKGESVPAKIVRPAEQYVATESNGVLHISAQIDTTGGTKGTLAVGFSSVRLEQETRRDFLTTLVVALILAGAGVLLALIIGTLVARPVTTLTQVTARIVEKRDLGVQVAVESNDEVGMLAESFGKMLEWLRSTVGSLNRLVAGLTNVIEGLTETGKSVADGALLIRNQMTGTLSSVSHMRTSLKGLADNVGVLQSSASQGASSIVQMASINDDVAKNVQSMAESVNTTASAMQRMTAAYSDTAESIEKLNQTLIGTSSSMTQVDGAIRDVEKTASETARLSDKVSADAETGVAALDKTVHGIEEIRSSTGTAAQVISSLGDSVSRIGTILKVISDITHQTNLLSLNASIIAAQAGEHGKGFGIVANEIKTLAERTSSSTTEIAALIKAIQEESQQAQMAMERGMQSVQEGVQLGREARDALAQIHDSAQQAKMMVRAIARATEEQARGTNQVTGSIQRISETVQDLSTASGAQAHGSEEVNQSTTRMKLLTQEVERSGREQARGSKQVIGAIEKIQGMVEQVSKAQAEQTGASEQVLTAVDAIQDVVHNQTAAAAKLERAILSLRQHADELKTEVERFSL